MKISVDGILGSARKINNQRQTAEESAGSRKKDVRTDSVNISSRVNSRLDSIDTEIRDLQSSLTRNQILRQGIEDIQKDMATGGNNGEKIMSEVRFEGRQVLKEFIGGTITAETLQNRAGEVAAALGKDMNRLKTLQVELDNITASNLAGSEKAGSVMSTMESTLSSLGSKNMEGITNLNADSVMRLVR